ncbi:MAG: ACT domain-containing protein [Sphaerochaetaceae bacterium]|nr:ACT domain-containing protein [Sphaerochaetaceae bacterium]
MENTSIKLILKKNVYNIYKLERELNSNIKGTFFYAKTNDEFSLVCNNKNIIDNYLEKETGYHMLKIDGILDFSLVGIIANITSILAKEKISVFVVSTFNTDYILIKEKFIKLAVKILKNNNFKIQSES